MEPSGTDIKPTTSAGDSANDTPDKGLLMVASVSKLKHSRYEDVWPEDVHAAFMEAVALYPPMGKRRLKYYRVSTHENERFSDVNRAKSFGRCQLIQSYILEKTGKNRSRKQVSSHLQRLKKIHKDNPAMQPLFSERVQPPSEHCSAPRATTSSQDIFASISVSMCHVKSEVDADFATNLWNADTGTPGASLNDDSCNTPSLPTNSHEQSSYQGPKLLSPVPQQRQAGALHYSDSEYLPEFQDTLLFKDAVNEGFRSGPAFSTYMPAFSTSARRLPSKLSIQSRLVDSGLTMHLSRAIHSPGLQPTHQWISHDSLADGASYNSPLASAQEPLHAPLLPLQFFPSEKPLYPGPAPGWMWPRYSDLHLDPREASFDEIRFRYPTTMYQHSPTCPERRVDTLGFYSPPPGSEMSRLPREVSYLCTATSPATSVSKSVATCDGPGAIDFPRHSPGSSEDSATPLMIRPTPVYPVAYIHSDLHSSTHIDDHTALSLPP